MENLEKKENIINNLKVKENEDLIPLRDLKKEDLKEENGFYYFVAKLSKYTTKSGYERCSIIIKIHDLLSITLKQTINNKQVDLTLNRFNEILLSLNLPLFDNNSRNISSWTLKVPCRFVKGKYNSLEENEDDYLSFEVLFKQYLYQVYFFNKTEKNILDNLKIRKEFNYKILNRKNEIEKISDDIIQFDF